MRPTLAKEDIKKLPLKATIWKDETTRPMSYVVEAIDENNDGAVILTQFYEPGAKERAFEYAQNKFSEFEFRL